MNLGELIATFQIDTKQAIKAASDIRRLADSITSTLTGIAGAADQASGSLNALGKAALDLAKNAADATSKINAANAKIGTVEARTTKAAAGANKLSKGLKDITKDAQTATQATGKWVWAMEEGERVLKNTATGMTIHTNNSERMIRQLELSYRYEKQRAQVVREGVANLKNLEQAATSAYMKYGQLLVKGGEPRQMQLPGIAMPLKSVEAMKKQYEELVAANKQVNTVMGQTPALCESVGKSATKASQLVLPLQNVLESTTKTLPPVAQQSAQAAKQVGFFGGVVDKVRSKFSGWFQSTKQLVTGSSGVAQATSRATSAVAAAAPVHDRATASAGRHARAQATLGKQVTMTAEQVNAGTRKVAGSAIGWMRGQTTFVQMVKGVATGMLTYRAIMGTMNLIRGAIFGTIGAAIAFEAEFAQVRKVMNATDPEFAQLAQNFRKLALEIPIPLKQITAMGQAGARMGIAPEHLTAFTKVVSQLATVADDLSFDEAATSLARFANITGMAQTEFENFGSALIAVADTAGGTTEKLVLNMAMGIAAVGKRINLTVPQMLAWSSAVTSIGIAPQTGATALSRFFDSIQLAVAGGSDKLKLFAKVAGAGLGDAAMDGKKFADMFRKDANGAVMAFLKGLGELSGGTEEAIVILEKLGMSDRRLLRTISGLAFSYANLKKVMDTATPSYEKHTRLADKFSEISGTAEKQIELFKNAMNDLGIELGGAVIPLLKDAIANGLLFIGWLKNVVSFISPILPSFTALTKAVIGLAAAWATLFAIEKIGAWVTAINGALRAGFLLQKTYKEIATLQTLSFASALSIGKVGKGDTKVFVGELKGLNRVVAQTILIFRQARSAIWALLSGNWKNLAASISAIGTTLGIVGSKISIFGSIVRFLFGPGGLLIAAGIGVASFIASNKELQNTFSHVWEGIKETVSKAIGDIGDIISGSRSKMKPPDGVKSDWDTFWDELYNTATTYCKLIAYGWLALTKVAVASIKLLSAATAYQITKNPEQLAIAAEAVLELKTGLVELGIDVVAMEKLMQGYNIRVNDAAAVSGKWAKSLTAAEQAELLGGLTKAELAKQAGMAAAGMREMTEEAEREYDAFYKAARPADAMAEEILKFADRAGTAAERAERLKLAIAGHADEFIRAAKEQKAYPLEDFTKELLKQANAFAALHPSEKISSWMEKVRDYKVPVQEYTSAIDNLSKSLEEMGVPATSQDKIVGGLRKQLEYIQSITTLNNSGLAAYGKTTAQQQETLDKLRESKAALEKIREYTTVIQQMSRLDTRDKLQQLEFEQQLVDTMGARTEGERRAMELRKVDLDFAIREQQLLKKYDQDREDIRERIQKLGLGGGAESAALEEAMYAWLEKNLNISKERLAILREARKEELARNNIVKDTTTLEDIRLQVDKAVTRETLAQLQLQEQILGTMVPLNETERERMELQRVNLQYAIRQEELRAKYAQEAENIQHRIDQELVAGTEQRAEAEKELGRLRLGYEAQLQDAAALRLAETVAVYREQYLRMVDSIKEGAGEIFDSMVSSGKSAFSSLMDWIKATFLSFGRKIFQNFVATIFAPNTNQSFFENIFQDVFPKYRKIPNVNVEDLIRSVGPKGDQKTVFDQPVKKFDTSVGNFERAVVQFGNILQKVGGAITPQNPFANYNVLGPGPSQTYEDTIVGPLADSANIILTGAEQLDKDTKAFDDATKNFYDFTGGFGENVDQFSEATTPFSRSLKSFANSVFPLLQRMLLGTGNAGGVAGGILGTLFNSAQAAAKTSPPPSGSQQGFWENGVWQEGQMGPSADLKGGSKWSNVFGGLFSKENWTGNGPFGLPEGGFNNQGIGGMPGMLMTSIGSMLYLDSLRKKGKGSWLEAMGGAGMASMAMGFGLIPGMGLGLFSKGVTKKGAGGWAATIGGGAMMGAYFGPIGAGIGALVGLVTKIVQFLHKSAYEKGAKEVQRDFGGVEISDKSIKEFTQGIGLSESQFAPIRKDILSSPKFLVEVAAPAAKAQGLWEPFLQSLEEVKTAWGTFNFREAFELGDLLGDYTLLNQLFVDAFQNSEALRQNMPDWQQKLMATGDAAKTTLEKLMDPWKTFYTNLKESIEPAQTMFDTFLEGGIITDELAFEINRLGGDLSKFQDVADLMKLQQDFEDNLAVFSETGEILPELREQILGLGGDLQLLDDMAELGNLKKSLTFIQDLKTGIEGMVDALSPVEKLLKGIMDADVEEALRAAGLDPNKFVEILPLIKMQTGWDDAVDEFFSGMRYEWSDVANRYIQKRVGLVKGGLVEQMLLQYGGPEGKTAVEKYWQGVNTITPALLENVRLAAEKDFQEKATGLLEYIGQQEEALGTKIETLQDSVNGRLDKIKATIGSDLNAAKNALLLGLGPVLIAAYREAKVIDEGGTITPTIPNTGAGTVINGVSYYNAKGQPYTNEAYSYWLNKGENQWYQGTKATGSIFTIPYPPWATTTTGTGTGAGTGTGGTGTNPANRYNENTGTYGNYPSERPPSYPPNLPWPPQNNYYYGSGRGYQLGGVVASTGLAMVHKGEVFSGDKGQFFVKMVEDLLRRVATPRIPTIKQPTITIPTLPRTPSATPVAPLGSQMTDWRERVQNMFDGLEMPQGGPTVVVQGPIYGWSNFVEEVRKAGVELKRVGNERTRRL